MSWELLEVDEIDYKYEAGHYNREYWGKCVLGKGGDTLAWFSEDGSTCVTLSALYLGTEKVFSPSEYVKLLKKQERKPADKISVGVLLALREKYSFEEVIKLIEMGVLKPER